MTDPMRENSVFMSKTTLSSNEKPITADLDFYGHAGQVSLYTREAPGSRGLHWPVPPDPREVVRDPGLDEFCDSVSYSLSGDVMRSSRKYASSFQSTLKRGTDAVPGTQRATSPVLGPGVYSVPLDTIKVRDTKRMNYTFKSQTDSSLFGAEAGQPPDTVQSIQSAILGRHWTSKGVAFSTRERFPRQRSRWKD